MLSLSAVSCAGVKNAVFLTYLFSYYITLLCLVVFFYYTGGRSLKYFVELSFCSNNAAVSTFITMVVLTLTGLPPLFLFFGKTAMLAIIILNQPGVVAVLALSLVFGGWFIYLNAIKTLNHSTWSFSTPTEFGGASVSTVLSLLLVFFANFLFWGGFVVFDVFIFVQWLCV
jgi:NADH:ubiquinone oxidoreductase subunit 2 (subunit N)